MSVIKIKTASEALFREVDITVIAPFNFKNNPNLKTMLLLHGAFGTNDDWLFNTRIRSYAEENNIFVIMPNGNNSFYTNNNYENYFTFISEEIFSILDKNFVLPKTKTLIVAGNSMGGLGALKTGLLSKLPITHICALSPVVSGKKIIKQNLIPFLIHNKENILKKENEVESYLNLAKDKNVYIRCGKDDFLYAFNKELLLKANNMGIKINFEETEGAHTWDFWDREIKIYIDTVVNLI